MMKSTLVRIAAFAIPIALWAMPAAAYVGPGAGITLLGALWGVLIAIAAAVGFIILWPLRRALVARRQASSTSEEKSRDAVPPANPSRS